MSFPRISIAAPLTVVDHRRDGAGLTYVYPVVSRRAGGVSIGINLNPNNACNWRCVYCQVPELRRGGPPPIDLDLLERELRRLLDDVLHGDFMAENVPEDLRRLEDVAFSGNGEPTTAAEFPEAVGVAERVLMEFGLLRRIKVRLITNGSQLSRRQVRDAIAHLARIDGEVWFKVDAGTAGGIRRINNAALSPQTVVKRLRDCAMLCPTWVQTCVFAWDGEPPGSAEMDAWLQILEQADRPAAAAHGGLLRGVHLYGLARPSMQPEAPQLAPLPLEWLESLARRARQKGLTVLVSP